jgi:hypothetical protein
MNSNFSSSDSSGPAQPGDDLFKIIRHEFGINVAGQMINIEARVLKAPALGYQKRGEVRLDNDMLG